MGECLIIRSGGGTDTSGATATAARVLSGYTCYVNDSKITGTMVNQGTKNASLNAGGSYTIPAGYHSGSGKVTANALSGQTSGTATAARILSGRTAWVNGSKLTGTMTNRGAISQKLAANGSYTVPAGWHNGSGKVTQSLTTQGAKTVTPTTSNQTACAASRWTTGTITIVGSSTLTAGNIKKGVKIFNVTGTFTGIIDRGDINLFTGRNGNFNYGEYVERESTVIRGVTATWHSYEVDPWDWDNHSTMVITFPEQVTGISYVSFGGYVKYRTSGEICITYYDGAESRTYFSESDMWTSPDDYGYGSFWHFHRAGSVSSSIAIHWINFISSNTRQDWAWGIRCIIRYNP